MDQKFHDEVHQVRQQLSRSEVPELFNVGLQESLNDVEGILHEAFVSPTWSLPRKPCILLEVYADSNSPLTDAMNHLGYFAIRFTRKDGDLSTTEGRKALWKLIDEHQPLNIWVAPECGPWGGWNRLNMFKSVALFDKVMAWQKREACHVELCSQLYVPFRLRGAVIFTWNNRMVPPCLSCLRFKPSEKPPKEQVLTCACLV